MMLREGGYHKLEIGYGSGDLISRTQGKIASLGLIKPVAHWKICQIFCNSKFCQITTGKHQFLFSFFLEF
jgi:hypothetical protein